MSGRVLDLFAGLGGWEERGDRTIGVELDADACASRHAAGWLTIRQDVRTVDPARFAPLDGLIASPPCQTFSAAGKGDGVTELAGLVGHVHQCLAGWREPPTFGDPRTGLVLEPLRFALGCIPTWVALEQVPAVLPIWEAYARTLRALGWSTWCGILNAADYGVPQTRRRAILLAHRRHPVGPPEPTHCEGGASTLLGELAPWVSMAAALGWGATERPITTVAAGHTRGTVGGGSGGRASIERERERGAWRTLHTNRGQDKDGQRQTRDLNQPAPAVSAKAGPQWEVCPDEAVPTGMGQGIKLTVRDALLLQSFPADTPVLGSKTAQFMQVGNAIPPLLARRLLKVLR